MSIWFISQLPVGLFLFVDLKLFLNCYCPVKGHGTGERQLVIPLRPTNINCQLFMNEGHVGTH
jgi:hypothetical protein